MEVMPKIESQIVKNNAILVRLEGKGKYMADSGEHIRTGARYANLPGGFYARGAKFSTTQKETVKEFIHDWKMAYVDKHVMSTLNSAISVELPMAVNS
jgi:hypothetical protein